MASHTCENMLYKLLYVIQGVENKVTNFLASADIRVFGRTCLLTMLLLIGFALFYTPGVLHKYIRIAM